jgi:glycosyltransferase involved in cell wall biosynthesis
MDEADVAVTLPVYNGGSQVRQALDCLLEQTVQPAEIIAVDDGSSDETPAILFEYEREHDLVRVLTHETNQGLPTALNTAIEATDRTYIARQDVDDRSRPNRIEEQYQYMTSNPSVDIVGTAADVIDEQGNVLDTIYPPSDPSSVLNERNPFVHGSVMMRRQAVEDAGGYDPLFEYSQDYDLWTRLDRAGYRLDSMQAVLYELERSQTHLSIDQRQRRILFGLAARGDPEQKEQYRSIIWEQDIREIYDRLPQAERAVYNRQSAEICIKQGFWAMTIQETAPAILHDPVSVRTGTMLGLSLLPPPVSRRILGSVQAF